MPSRQGNNPLNTISPPVPLIFHREDNIPLGNINPVPMHFGHLPCRLLPDKSQLFPLLINIPARLVFLETFHLLLPREHTGKELISPLHGHSPLGQQIYFRMNPVMFIYRTFCPIDSYPVSNRDIPTPQQYRCRPHAHRPSHDTHTLVPRDLRSFLPGYIPIIVEQKQITRSLHVLHGTFIHTPTAKK